jgi:hypothetical protein
LLGLVAICSRRTSYLHRHVIRQECYTSNMYEKLDNRTNSTRRQRVSYTLGKQILFISVYELESAPLRRFTSFRSSFSLCGHNFYSFILFSLSITCFGNLRLAGLYYWPYYWLLVTFKGPRLLLLTYRSVAKVTYS